jgi:hypothetical protein
MWVCSHKRQRVGDEPRPRLIERGSSVRLLSHSVPGTAKNAHCRNQYRLLRSSTCGRNAKHHLRATVQSDILFRAKQDAGGLSHPRVLLPRRIVRQQYTGNRRGGDGDIARFGYDSPRCGSTVSCGSCPGITARALRSATRSAAAISPTRARVRRAACGRPGHGSGSASRCRALRWSDRLNLQVDRYALATL